MNLFKYTTAENATKILSYQKIRFTQPIAFNDPFDALPFVAKLYSKEEQRLLTEKIFSNKKIVEELTLNSFYKTLGNDYLHPELIFGKEELLKMFYSEIESGYGSVANFVLSGTNEEEMLEKTLNGFINNLLTLTGVLSLTTDPKNLLMWAHYADCHRGIVFEFDGKHPFFKQSDNQIYPTKIGTNYTDDRPKIEFQISDFNDNNRLYKMFSETYFTKSTEWKYEAEYRVVRRLELKTNSGEKDINGFDIHLFDLPKEIIKSVILGNKIKPKVAEEIENILAEKQYNNVSLKRIVLDKEKYLLHIEEN